MRTTLYTTLFLAASSLHAQRPLMISGQAVLAPDGEHPVTMSLINWIGDTVATRHSHNGRFRFRMDRNEPYVVSFMQPGSITKEVLVDTSNLPPLRRDAHVRHVRFDVVMDDGDPDRRMRYTRPVGYIRFRPQAGSVHVVYDDAHEVMSDVP